MLNNLWETFEKAGDLSVIRINVLFGQEVEAGINGKIGRSAHLSFISDPTFIELLFTNCKRFFS